MLGQIIFALTLPPILLRNRPPRAGDSAFVADRTGWIDDNTRRLLSGFRDLRVISPERGSSFEANLGPIELPDVAARQILLTRINGSRHPSFAADVHPPAIEMKILAHHVAAFEDAVESDDGQILVFHPDFSLK